MSLESVMFIKAILLHPAMGRCFPLAHIQLLRVFEQEVNAFLLEQIYVNCKETEEVKAYILYADIHFISILFTIIEK